MEKQQRVTTLAIRTLLLNNGSSASQLATRSSISRSIASTSCSTGNTSGGMSVFVTRNDTLTAEVWWALQVNSSHYSYKSCEDINFLPQQIFLDGDIAKKFSCGEKKASYLTCFGIAPYFKSVLREKSQILRWLCAFLWWKSESWTAKEADGFNLVPRAFPFEIGRGGKRPWHQLVIRSQTPKHSGCNKLYDECVK